MSLLGGLIRRQVQDFPQGHKPITIRIQTLDNALDALVLGMGLDDAQGNLKVRDGDVALLVRADLDEGGEGGGLVVLGQLPLDLGEHLVHPAAQGVRDLGRVLVRDLLELQDVLWDVCECVCVCVCVCLWVVQ